MMHTFLYPHSRFGHPNTVTARPRIGRRRSPPHRCKTVRQRTRHHHRYTTGIRRCLRRIVDARRTVRCPIGMHRLRNPLHPCRTPRHHSPHHCSMMHTFLDPHSSSGHPHTATVRPRIGRRRSARLRCKTVRQRTRHHLHTAHIRHCLRRIFDPRHTVTARPRIGRRRSPPHRCKKPRRHILSASPGCSGGRFRFAHDTSGNLAGSRHPPCI